MTLLSAKSLAGPGYIILNVLRGMNITGLLAVAAASIVMLVKTVIESNLFFFDGVSHVITACISIFLVVSETSLFRGYFARNWPLLSPRHGFVALGGAMLILGVNILGNLNKRATSQKNLGLAFWRIVIGSGILVMILGVFNIVASYVFRDAPSGVTARQVRAKGAVALDTLPTSNKSYTFASTPSQAKTPATVKTQFTATTSPYTPVSENNTGNAEASKQSTGKPDGSSRFSRFARPILPTYHQIMGSRAPKSPPPPSSRYSVRSDDSGRPKMQISGPMEINPQFAHLVKRPDDAHHPSNRAGAF